MERTELGREPRRGDLFWIPGERLPERPSAQPHPYLVLQEDVFNRSRITTVVVCALSTMLSKATEPGNILLEPGEGGLPRQSVVVVSQILSIEKSALGEYIGSLSVARVQQALEGLRFQQRAFFREEG